MSNTEAYETARVFLTESRDFPSGVGSVSISFGFLCALTEPVMHVLDDFSLIGFEVSKFCQHTAPPLTTVWQDRSEVGRGAVQRLKAMVEASPLIVPTQLVVRKSTGPAPKESS